MSLKTSDRALGAVLCFGNAVSKEKLVVNGLSYTQQKQSTHSRNKAPTAHTAPTARGSLK